jgi:hypothetical protein
MSYRDISTVLSVAHTFSCRACRHTPGCKCSTCIFLYHSDVWNEAAVWNLLLWASLPLARETVYSHETDTYVEHLPQLTLRRPTDSSPIRILERLLSVIHQHRLSAHIKSWDVNPLTPPVRTSILSVPFDSVSSSQIKESLISVGVRFRRCSISSQAGHSICGRTVGPATLPSFTDLRMHWGDACSLGRYGEQYFLLLVDTLLSPLNIISLLIRKIR